MKNLATFAFKIVLPLVILVSMVSSLYTPAQAAPSGERLRSLAGPFLVGFASRNNFDSMSDSAIYQETARAEFNFLTPENAMKWDAIHPQQATYSFGEADKHVAFAQANNMAIHGHTLVWHSQLPSWVANGSWTEATLTSAMYSHIDTVMARYKGKIAVWDVVNEAFNEDGSYRTSVFYNTIGKKYIELAFQRARIADPDAKLVYNDYNVEAIGAKSTAMYNMVADFKARGIPIDGVGLQMHLTSGGLDYASLVSNMQRFANLGVEVYITEMDVRFRTPVSQTDLTNQATIYRNVLNRCLLQPACKGFQVWGIPDKYSWVPDVFPGEGAALIFDDNYAPKPAYYALQAELAANPRATATPCVNCTPTSTSTPVTPTQTPTASNTPNPNGALKVQLSASGTDNSQQSAFNLRVRNTGVSALSNISVRVYFTPDGSQPASSYVLEKYYDQSSAATISGPTLSSGLVYYFTINYGTASLAPGASWDFNTALHLNNWASSYTSSNDWWRVGGTLPTVYTDWMNIPGYVAGSLVWGSVPDTVITPTFTPSPTATKTATATPSATMCPQATPAPVWVEPVTSPTNLLTQEIVISAPGMDSATVTLQSGTFTVTTTTSPVRVVVDLLPNTTHSLTVSAHIKQTTGPGGCIYGGYTISTTRDRFGAPLTIIQSTGPTFTPTATFTATNTFTPSPTYTATATATATPTRHPATCSVLYSIANDWGAGFTANVTILNTGSSAINGWNLAWNFPGNQTITNLWSGSHTQTGKAVTVSNLGYNASIPAGGSTSFGFNANYSGSNALPTAFTLNGAACTVIVP